MKRLDCSTPDRSLRSLAGIVGLPEDELRRRLQRASPAMLQVPAVPPAETLLELILGPGDVSRPPDETVWFHGSRLPPHTSFADGLLPLHLCLPTLTDLVDSLAREVGVPENQLGRSHPSGSMVAKLTSLDSQGPNASLLKDAVMSPRGAQRSFLDTPEIVEDLARVSAGTLAPQVLDLYRERTVPCVVSFVGREPRTDVVRRALMYVHATLHEDDNPVFWNTCFNGRGHAVVAADILEVQWLRA